MTPRFKRLGNELREERRTPGSTRFYKRESVRHVRRRPAVEQDLAAIGPFNTYRDLEDLAIADNDFWWEECPCCLDSYIASVRMGRLGAYVFSDRAPLTVRPFASLRVAA